MTFKPLGHWLHVRKCVRPESLGGVLIPEKSREFTSWAEVLAVGPLCGQPSSSMRMKTRKTDICKRMADPPKVGALVQLPNDHPWGIVHIPHVGEWDYLVDETVPLIVQDQADSPAGVSP